MRTLLDKNARVVVILKAGRETFSTCSSVQPGDTIHIVAGAPPQTKREGVDQAHNTWFNVLTRNTTM